jgi:hypothetical protein
MHTHRTGDVGDGTLGKSSLLRVVDGGRSPAGLAAIDEAIERGLREVVGGYERAIAAMGPDDLEATAWFRGRLHDARIAAGLPVFESVVGA